MAAIATVSTRAVGGSSNTSYFGAVFFVLSTRSDLVHIADVAGQRVEGSDLTGFQGFQAQWIEMQSHNLSFWSLPKVVVFSHSTALVVADVASGAADVGMMRTDVLEYVTSPSCTPGAPGTAASAGGPACFPPGTFRVLDPKPAQGSSFPFATSTQLWPEWPLGAMPHVDAPTQSAVAAALSSVPPSVGAPAGVASFTPPLAYASLYVAQQQIGWVQPNGSCLVPPASLRTWATIDCPAGSVKSSPAAVEASCASANVTCPVGYDCVCAPCTPVPPVALSLQIQYTPLPTPPSAMPLPPPPPSPLPGSNASSPPPASAAASPSGGAAVVTSPPCVELQPCAAVAQVAPGGSPPPRPGFTALVSDAWAPHGARAALGAPPITSVVLRFHGSSGFEDASSGFVSLPVASRTSDGEPLTWAIAVPTPRVGLFLLVRAPLPLL